MRRPTGVAAGGPLDAFAHDIDFTRFDTRLGRLIPLALGVAVAVVAVQLGMVAAYGVTGLIGARLVAVPDTSLIWQPHEPNPRSRGE